MLFFGLFAPSIGCVISQAVNLGITFYMIRKGFSSAAETSTDNPTCFNTCFGINSTIYNSAIASFCSANAGAKLSQYSSSGYDFSIGMPYNYAPQPGTDEEGLVWLQATAVKDYTCPDGMVLEYNTCIYNMNVPVEKCNVGEEGKQGGHWTVPCLAFTLQPNPKGC